MIVRQHWLCISALFLTIAYTPTGTSHAWGQVIDGLRCDDPQADAKARVLGMLCTPLTLDFNDVPARDAFNAIAGALA